MQQDTQTQNTTPKKQIHDRRFNSVSLGISQHFEELDWSAMSTAGICTADAQ